MTKELESGALSILEYSQTLSGGVKPTADSATGAPERMRSSGTGSGESPAAQIQFPSESGHWYDPKTGNQVELKPRTWTKTAIKQGYVPGVTTITRQLHKEQLRVYDVNRAIIACSEILQDLDDDMWMSNELLTRHVRELMKAESDEIMGRGKELHAAIEAYGRGSGYGYKWQPHMGSLSNILESESIDLFSGNTEHSFATSRYGGKIDWHNDEWLLDFKTKPRIEDGKKLAYPEHCWQLAAYSAGLYSSHKPRCPATRRCSNVFIGVEDAKVVFHEWTEQDLLKGWRKFEALLNVWWSDYEN